MTVTNVMNVLINVFIVLIMLITVLNVSHQDSQLHHVTAQMVISIMVTLVSVVLITVPLVLPEPNVLLVLISELTPQVVNAQKDIMTQVKLNVNYVTGNV
jgi:hypothetical protein